MDGKLQADLARRIGGYGIPVPPPEIALLRHQPLARTQMVLRRAAFLCRHDSGEGEPARKSRRRFDESRERDPGR